MKALFLFPILFVVAKQQSTEKIITQSTEFTTALKTTITQSECLVRLRTPMNNDTLTQNYGKGEKLESNWRFSWFHCQNATKYHLYVIGPNALNPIVNTDTISKTSYISKSRHYGIKHIEGWTWKVRAYSGGRWGEWSEIRTFSVNSIPCTISGNIFGSLEGVSYSDAGNEQRKVKVQKIYLTTPDGKLVNTAILHNRQYQFKNVPAGKTYRIYPEFIFKAEPEFIEIKNTSSKAKYHKRDFTIRGVKGNG